MFTCAYKNLKNNLIFTSININTLYKQIFIRVILKFLQNLPSVATFVQWPLGLGVAMGRNQVACGSDS